ncbi:DUF4145 domain-containing protein [Yersinia enterocolitica]|nr:DUF4145 domain-containing protein [Yersinia enterocolitica]
MSAEEIYKAHCPTCDGERKCLVHGKTEKHQEYDDGVNYMSAHTKHKLMECLGCETVFYHKISTDSEDVHYDYDHEGNTIQIPVETIATYPTPEQSDVRPEWLWDLISIDKQLFTIMDETYSAYEKKSYILASIGLRTIFDRTTEVLKIHAALSMIEKVNELKNDGLIGDIEKSQLLIVTDVGNAAAHRAWSPKKAEFKSLLTIIEDFTRRMILKDNNVNKIAEAIPKKQKRPEKLTITKEISSQEKIE